MKDIMLESNGDGTYDWSFRNNDLNVVNGVYSLLNSVIHAVLLRNQELEAVIYQGKGSFLDEYLKMKDTARNRELVQNSLQATINEIDGVYDSTVAVRIHDGRILVADVTIIREDGREVNIGGI